MWDPEVAPDTPHMVYASPWSHEHSQRLALCDPSLCHSGGRCLNANCLRTCSMRALFGRPAPALGDALCGHFWADVKSSQAFGHQVSGQATGVRSGSRPGQVSGQAPDQARSHTKSGVRTGVKSVVMSQVRSGVKSGQASGQSRCQVKPWVRCQVAGQVGSQAKAGVNSGQVSGQVRSGVRSGEVLGQASGRFRCHVSSDARSCQVSSHVRPQVSVWVR